MSRAGGLHKGRAFTVCRADDLPPGERLLVEIAGKHIGVFNVDGHYYALLNYCPHRGGALCLGPVTGTTLPTTGREFIYGRAGSILRCAWHGWEFDIPTGDCLVDERMRARTYPVTVEAGEVVVHI